MSDWKEFSIGEIADPTDRYSFSGGPFGSNLKSEEYTDGGVRIIQLQNIGDGYFKDNYKIYTSEEKADELLSCNIYPGEIILSKMGDPVARATLIPDSEERYLMASDGIRLKVDTTRFDSTFILNAINSPQFRNSAEAVSVGSTRKRIGLTTLKGLTIYAPSLPEQKKIAEILSGIDYFIEKVETEATKYESLRQATLYEYPLRHSSGQVLLGECAILQAGGTPDRGKSSFWNGNIPWVKTGEVNYNLITSTEECISEEGLQSSSARLLPEGSILMAMYGQGVTRGRVAKLGISASTNQACLAINSCTPEMSNDYLYWILTSKYEHLRSQVQEGTQKNLSKGIVGDQIIPLLEGRRQEEFCKLCSNFDALIKLKRREASALSKLKNSLSSDLLSGRKRVTI
jgi:type I restriction enzyme, S subunit